MKKQTLLGLAFIIIAGLLFFSFKTGQTTPKKYVTIRIMERGSIGINASPIVIAYDDGKTEEYLLTTSLTDVFKKNTIIINDILNDFSEKGYHLDFVVGNGGKDDLYTSYIFSK